MIVSDLIHRIQRSEYPPGSKIPSYRQLAESYRVCVATAQRAVRELRISGVLIGMQGRGVYVNKI
jgi:DNA-binding GntR family transcriptional regulator